MAILEELTLIDVNLEGSLILGLDDPQLFKYPVVYMWEPGYWRSATRRPSIPRISAEGRPGHLR